MYMKIIHVHNVQESKTKKGGETMSAEECALICFGLSFTAMMFSWITMAAGKSIFFWVAVLITAIEIVLAGYGLFCL